MEEQCACNRVNCQINIMLTSIKEKLAKIRKDWGESVAFNKDIDIFENADKKKKLNKEIDGIINLCLFFKKTDKCPNSIRKSQVKQKIKQQLTELKMIRS